MYSETMQCKVFAEKQYGLRVEQVFMSQQLRLCMLLTAYPPAFH